MFKKLINFIKNRRYNLFYYYRCLNKKIDEYGILLCSSYGKDINGNIFYILKELNKKEYSKYRKYVVVNKKYKLEFMNKLSFYHISSYDLVIIDSWKYINDGYYLTEEESNRVVHDIFKTAFVKLL